MIGEWSSALVAGITAAAAEPEKRFLLWAEAIGLGAKGYVCELRRSREDGRWWGHGLWADGVLTVPPDRLWCRGSGEQLTISSPPPGPCRLSHQDALMRELAKSMAPGACQGWWIPLSEADEQRGLVIAAPHPLKVDRPPAEVGYLTHLLLLALERTAARTALAEAERRCSYQIQQIAAIQRALLPRDDLEVPGVKILAHFAAAAGAGGDYYDLVSLGQTGSGQVRWGAMIADAAGHGPGAAVEVAMLDAILRTYRGSVEEGPGRVLDYANRHLFTRRVRASFITAFIVNYDAALHRLSYANAGHPPALLKRCRTSGDVEILGEPAGIPLGVDKTAAWTHGGIDMAPGDCLVLYTDGITEAQSVQDEQFGLGRLVDLVVQARAEPQAIRDAVCAALDQHLDGHSAADDQTLIVLQALGPDQKPA